MNPIEKTEALTDELEVKRACASIPELKLESGESSDSDESKDSTDDKNLAATAQDELDENCTPQ